MSSTVVLKYALTSWMFLTLKGYSDNREKDSYLTLIVKIPAINEKLCDINEKKNHICFKRL